MQGRARVLVALLALTLVGCNRPVEGNPNPPVTPATANATESAASSAPDTLPGGPSGVKGSPTPAGSSGGDAALGTSGSGTSDASSSQGAQPGAGLSGGLTGTSGLGMTGSFPTGTATQSFGSGLAIEGSPHRAPRSGLGTR
jgi:hypothetical protein